MRLLSTLLAACMLLVADATYAAPATTATNISALNPKSRYHRPHDALRPMHKRKKVHVKNRPLVR